MTTMITQCLKVKLTEGLRKGELSVCILSRESEYAEWSGCISYTYSSIDKAKEVFANLTKK